MTTTTTKQTYTSANTSINSTKAPAVYNMPKAIKAMTGKRVLDIGGGKYDTAQNAARTYGATVSVYDPYNRSTEHNHTVLAQSYDVAIISNVLNVIDSDTARRDVLQLAGSKANTLLIAVYEGDKSGVGRQTQQDSWQANRQTANYVDEIADTLTNWKITRYGKLIIATKL